MVEVCWEIPCNRTLFALFVHDTVSARLRHALCSHRSRCPAFGFIVCKSCNGMCLCESSKNIDSTCCNEITALLSTANTNTMCASQFLVFHHIDVLSVPYLRIYSTRQETDIRRRTTERRLLHRLHGELSCTCVLASSTATTTSDSPPSSGVPIVSARDET
jgi:hypothetical protein